MITGQIVSKCNSNEYKVNDNVNKNNLLQNFLSLQIKVNQLNIDKKSIVCKVQSEAKKYFLAGAN